MSALGLVHASVPDAELLVQSRTTRPAPRGVTVMRDASHAEIRRLYARAGVVAVATHPNLHVSGMTVGARGRADQPARRHDAYAWRRGLPDGRGRRASSCRLMTRKRWRPR